MTAVVQLPIIDLRPLLRERTGRLPVPSWPDPMSGKEFVRGVGLVVDRRRGTFDNIAAERSHCDAARLIRIRDESTSAREVIFRRLFCSGTAGRVEVALKFRPRSVTDARELAHEVLQVDVRTRSDASYKPLEEIGTSLAVALCRASTAHDFLESLEECSAHRRLVRSGRPAVLVESVISHGPATLVGTHLPRRHQDLPYWHALLPRSGSWTTVRRQRGRVWRTHMEIEAIRSVIRAWHADHDQFDPDLLREFLAETMGDLVKLRSGAVANHPALLAFNWGFEPLAPDDVLASLRDEVLSRSKGLVRKLDLILERSAGVARPAGTYINHLTISGGSVNVGDESQIVAAENVGAVISGSASVSGGQFQGAGHQEGGDVWTAFIESVDKRQLASELVDLSVQLRLRAQHPEHDIAIAEVAKALVALEQDDKQGMRDHLAKGGRWVLDAAKSVGSSVAAAAIKAAIGLS